MRRFGFVVLLHAWYSRSWASNLNARLSRSSAVVIGANGGLGSAFVTALAKSKRFALIHALSRARCQSLPACVQWQSVDLENEESIEVAATAVKNVGVPVALVLVATGILHKGNEFRPEKTWRAQTRDAFARSFLINTIGPALVAKHFLPLLDCRRQSVFAALSARVGSISDNRLGGWHAYRASKAALNMLIRNYAIELERRNPLAVCVGLHPGTVDTALSQPFQAQVPREHLFTPAFAVSRLLGVLDKLVPEDSGKVFAWDGNLVPE